MSVLCLEQHLLNWLSLSANWLLHVPSTHGLLNKQFEGRSDLITRVNLALLSKSEQITQFPLYIEIPWRFAEVINCNTFLSLVSSKMLVTWERESFFSVSCWRLRCQTWSNRYVSYDEWCVWVRSGCHIQFGQFRSALCGLNGFRDNVSMCCDSLLYKHFVWFVSIMVSQTKPETESSC